MQIQGDYNFRISRLVDSIAKSDRKAFGELFDLLWEPLFVFAKSLTMDENISKDIVQEVWIDLWKRRYSLNGKNIEAYLRTAVRNGCYKHFRSNKFNKVQLETIRSVGYENASTQIHDLEHTEETITKSLEKLPKRCQEIFKMSRIDEISNEEIANKLGISKRTVENQMSKALSAIRHTISISQIIFLIIYFSSQ